MAGSAATELKVLINILSSGTALPTLLKQTNQLSAALAKLQQQAGNVPTAPPLPPPNKAHIDHLENLDRAANKLVSTLKLLAGGFLAFESVRFIKDLADTAARAEVLSTVLHVVGNNAGYTAEALDKADRQIQSLGITATASRQALTQFLQAELELAKAPLLARAAQDAAVILGTNSSEAFSRLVTAVQTSNTQMLRHMGIIVSSDAAYQRFAQSIGKSVTQLTSVQRSEAFLDATLVAQARVQGTYAAAMGDVGKQLTSIDRLTQDLKTSIGNNLLPAYLAIVEELNQFLTVMKLTSDSIYGQGEGAKKLGDAVKEIAKDFRLLLGFLIDHRDIIIPILLLWAGLAKIAIPLIKAILELRVALLAIGTAEGGGLLAGMIEAFGLLGTGLIGLGLIIATAMVYFDRFRAAMMTVVDTVRVVHTAMDGLEKAITEGAFAAVKSLYNLMAHPLTPEAWWKPWKDWADEVIKQIHRVRDIWEATKARFKFAVEGDQSDDPEKKRKEARNKAIEEEIELSALIMLKTREYDELKKTADKATLEKALKALQELKDKGKALTEARMASQDELKMGQGQRDIEADTIKRRTQERLEQKVVEKLEEVRKNESFRYTETGGQIGVQFGKKLGEFNDLLSVYTMVGGKAKVTAREFAQVFMETAGITKTTDEYKALVTARNDLIAAGPISGDKEALAKWNTELGRINAAIRTAAVHVRDETIRETAETESIREKRFRDAEKRIANGYSERLELLKEAYAAEEALDKHAHDNRQLSDDAFYANQNTRRRAVNALELQQAINHYQSVVREQKAGFAKKGEDQEAVETRRLEALQEIRRAQATAATGEVEAGVSQYEANRSKAEQLYRIQLETAKAYGNEKDAVAVINEQYEERLRSLNVIAGSKEENIILGEKELELEKVHDEFSQKALARDLEILQTQRETLSARQDVLNVDKERVKALQATGNVTDVEAMRLRNALILRQNELDRDLLATKQEELERKRLEYRRQAALIVDRQSTMFDPESIETTDRLIKDLGALRKEIVGMESDVTTLSGTVETGMSSLESYGKQFKISFTDNLATAIQQSITEFNKAGEIWQNMAKSIANNIAGIFAKNLAQRISNLLHIDQMAERFFGGIGLGSSGTIKDPGVGYGIYAAEGGPVSGPGTGTSDSIIARVSTGEHIMPASKAAQFMPLLEGIRLGTILPYALGGMVGLQSIAIPPVIPRRYANGGVVVSDGGASQVQTGGGAANMVVTMHPDTLNMTMREWLEHEVVRQQGRR